MVPIEHVNVVRLDDVANRVKEESWIGLAQRCAELQLQQISRDEEGAGSAITQVKQAYMDYPAGDPMCFIRDLV